MRPARDSGEKPPKTTEWIAPIRPGEHGVGRLGDHRHIDGDAVAFLDPVLLQHVGEPAHMVVKLAVADLLVVIGVIALPDDRRLLAALLEVAVDAIVARC